MSRIVGIHVAAWATSRTTSGRPAKDPARRRLTTPAVPSNDEIDRLFFSDFTRLWPAVRNHRDASRQQQSQSRVKSEKK